MSGRIRRISSVVALWLLALTLSACGWIGYFQARDHLNQGVKAYHSQQHEAASEHFRQAYELDPELQIALVYLATNYRAQWVPGLPGQENDRLADLAIETFREVLEVDPENINAMASLALIYDGLGDPEEAKRWYNRRIEVEPENAEPYYGIGTLNWKAVHDQTGDAGSNVENLEEEELAELEQLVDQGVEVLGTALELNPEYSEAMQYLNLLYRERSYLSNDEEEKRRWEREADKLALQALEIKRRQEEEAERLRHTFGQEEAAQ